MADSHQTGSLTGIPRERQKALRTEYRRVKPATVQWILQQLAQPGKAKIIDLINTVKLLDYLDKSLLLGRDADQEQTQDVLQELARRADSNIE